MKLRFFVICWGENYADLYERVAIRSLTQPKNLEAIPSDAVVSVYSDARSLSRVTGISEALGRVEPHLIEDISNNLYEVQSDIFANETRRCVDEGASLVIVNPDNFWGDGSLAHLLAIAGGQDVCVAFPHVRVDQQKFLEMLPAEGIIENPELVFLAMESLHQSWRDADISKGSSNSFYTGIGIKRISSEIYAVQHMTPNVFYATLTEDDARFFDSQRKGRGVWDIFWPSALVKQGKLRTVASSDAVFVVELTDTDTHNTELRAINRLRHDEFYIDGPHVDISRNVISIWRKPIPTI